jgi:hypothetical protein
MPSSKTLLTYQCGNHQVKYTVTKHKNGHMWQWVCPECGYPQGPGEQDDSDSAINAAERSIKMHFAKAHS